MTSDCTSWYSFRADRFLGLESNSPGRGGGPFLCSALGTKSITFPDVFISTSLGLIGRCPIFPGCDLSMINGSSHLAWRYMISSFSQTSPSWLEACLSLRGCESQLRTSTNSDQALESR